MPNGLRLPLPIFLGWSPASFFSALIDVEATTADCSTNNNAILLLILLRVYRLLARGYSELFSLSLSVHCSKTKISIKFNVVYWIYQTCFFFALIITGVVTYNIFSSSSSSSSSSWSSSQIVMIVCTIIYWTEDMTYRMMSFQTNYWIVYDDVSLWIIRGM
jgi:hypothetical protein